MQNSQMFQSMFAHLILRNTALNGCYLCLHDIIMDLLHFNSSKFSFFVILTMLSIWYFYNMKKNSSMTNILKKPAACQLLRVLFRFISITRIRVAIFTNTCYAFTHVLLMCLFNGLFTQQISLGQVLHQHCVRCVDKSRKKNQNRQCF